MNKKIQLLAVALVLSATSFAQVGIGTTSPDASSALDITATDKGFLMPRMTTVQKTAIASPAEGLQVFDTDTKSVWIFNGTLWEEGAGGGKFVDGAVPEIAYYPERVGIGTRNNFSPHHRLWVEDIRTTDEVNTPLKVVASYTGTGTSLATYGLVSEAQNNSDATVNQASAFQPIVRNLKAGGNITTAVGSWPQVINSGSINFTAGVLSVINNSGTMESSFGLYVQYKSSNTSTTNYSYGIYIDPGFNKGLTENYAMYSDSDADSYFKGNIGAGVLTPQRKMHISGAMRLEPQAAAPTGGVLGDLYVNTDGKLYFHNGTAWKEVQLVP